MITGAHSVIYSKDAAADRAFFRDVLGLTHVDAGGGWLIFAMPQAEVAFHPSDTGGKHEFYLTCDDIAAFVEKMGNAGVTCSPIHQEPWGELVEITLPGGGSLGVYQPGHPMPQATA